MRGPAPTPQRTVGHAATGGGRRGRLSGIDGLRGIAALSVLLFHLWLYARVSPPAGAVSGVADWAWSSMRWGLILFFVLSGFLLYRPWLAAGRGGARPDLRRYARSRAARILPAYYLALAASVLLLWGSGAVPGVRLPSTESLPLFLVFAQNFSGGSLLTLDPPMWTLAVEVSFYLALPLLGLAALRIGRDRRALASGRPDRARHDLELGRERHRGPADADQGAAGDAAVLRDRDARRDAAGGPRAGNVRPAACSRWAPSPAWRPSSPSSGCCPTSPLRCTSFPSPRAAPRSSCWRARSRLRGCCAAGRCGRWARSPTASTSGTSRCCGGCARRGLLPLDPVAALPVVLLPSLALATLSWFWIERPAIAWARRVRSERLVPGVELVLPAASGP